VVTSIGLLPEIPAIMLHGVDILVRELAEEIARKEGLTKNGVLLIERRHVEQAGCLVVETLQRLFEDKKIPQAVAERLKGMESCFQSK